MCLFTVLFFLGISVLRAWPTLSSLSLSWRTKVRTWSQFGAVSWVQTLPVQMDHQEVWSINLMLVRAAQYMCDVTIRGLCDTLPVSSLYFLFQTQTLWVRKALLAVCVLRRRTTVTLWRTTLTLWPPVWMMVPNPPCHREPLNINLSSTHLLLMLLSIFQRNLKQTWRVCSLMMKNTSWIHVSASLHASFPASRTKSGQFTHNPPRLPGLYTWVLFLLHLLDVVVWTTLSGLLLGHGQ